MVTRTKSRTAAKWLIFWIVFILGMTVTFADVEGNQSGGSKQSAVTNDSHDVNPSQPAASDDELVTRSDDDPSGTASRQPAKPSMVPEPSTLILVGLGLGAALVLRRRRAS